MLLKLVDGGIENIKTDEEYHPGCPTCDYGSQYINDVEVILRSTSSEHRSTKCTIISFRRAICCK